MPKNYSKAIPSGHLQIVAERFKVLGDASRLQIIQALQSGEKNVGDLTKQSGLKQPNVSRHLSILLNARIVARRKAGQSVLYRIIDKSLMEICALVCRNLTT